MTHHTDPNLLVSRTCTLRDDKVGTLMSRRPLTDFRSAPAYVLLGDPGAGKTSAFKQEAAATGGHYIQARRFIAFAPDPELIDKTLFIDGLDEIRAGGGDGRTPLDHVRRHLERLNHPRFRLSCREADWYGDSDSAALLEVAREGSITVLHLDPLSDEDIILLLKRKFAVADPDRFIQQAEHHGLTDLLRNPQAMRLLTKAVGDSTWPDSRAKTYELACHELVREINPEHRSAKRDQTPPYQTLLDAAGFLCAVHLLAGISGFALDEDAVDNQHVLWRELLYPYEPTLPAALSCGLFQSDEGEQQRTPTHRSIAEFLGARYLATLIEAQALPLGRVVALMTGSDGGVAPDLRGLAAWLAVHCRNARSELVSLDPLGAILYGDVRDFTTEDKRLVLASLRAEAERYANFRFDDWTAPPFGALATPDMVPVFLEILAEPQHTESDIALVDCALDALLYGPPLTELTTAGELSRLEARLNAMVRDANSPPKARSTALKILLRNLSQNAADLVSLSIDLNAGVVRDEDDYLLGQLLIHLFPKFIQAEEIFKFLHPTRRDHVIGEYHVFWSHYLPKKAPNHLLPELLSQLIEHRTKLPDLPDQFEIEHMAGELLTRALKTYGDTIDDTRLHHWLGAGLDKYGRLQIDRENKKRVASWLAARPNRYKAVLLVTAKYCVDAENVWYCLYLGSERLYGAEPPNNIVPWYLELAKLETHPELKRHFFEQAVKQLIRKGEQEWLINDDLDVIGRWVEKHPEFESDLEHFTSCPLDHWHRQDFARKLKSDKERNLRKAEACRHVRENLETIQKGTADPKILDELAKVYLRNNRDISGETPQERLADLLCQEEELVEAVFSGFRHSLDRDDLPSVQEILNLITQNHHHFILLPCLVGMTEIYSHHPERALHLDDEVLRRLVAFRLAYGIDMEDEWFIALINIRPKLVAEVLIPYALTLLRTGRDHLFGIWPLAYNNHYGKVAHAALPDLLERFPLRAKNKQLTSILDPLLKAALRHLERSILASIVSAKLTKTSMSASQRIYWLACGLIVMPSKYEKSLTSHIGTSKALRRHLGAFLHDHEQIPSFNPSSLPESSLALLIELLAPDSPPERKLGSHWVSPEMHTADEVRSFINVLGGNPSKSATEEIARLIVLPELAPWLHRLHHAAQTQIIARRKAEFKWLSTTQICQTLSNLQPTNAADLAALTSDHLFNLARNIRDGSTNDYRQYWSLDESNKKPIRPKPENDCRDALLSDLKERLSRLRIDAIKEGYYAEEKRADIRVSYGGATGFNVPIEIKRDSHPDLWHAIHGQLIERYTRDPGTNGFGIYLAFWFGGKGMPLPQNGEKPRNAAELEQRLRSTLTSEQARHISVIVIDCALPG